LSVPPRDILWVDCSAALGAGLVVLPLSRWLAELYAMPRGLVVGIALANLCYGAYSFSLARRVRRPMSLVVLLVVANAAWATSCVVVACVFWEAASVLGLAHLLGEGLFVGGLASLEWTRRDRLTVPPTG
jgi:hypothetical protein